MEVGLCEHCTHVQVVRSAKGSLFYLCMLSKADPSFPKYPKLPVLTCPGYRSADSRDEAYRERGSDPEGLENL
jgi:hypothetical protein